MPDLDWNRSTWDGDYDWKGGGEEWSEVWGGSEAQWYGALYPRIHPFVPARRILEIAPGFGRWTRFLLPLCSDYVGVDLSAECVRACRERFARKRHAAFLQNDGRSLASAAVSGPFDFIFSFDSLVHADRDVLDTYVTEILALLSPEGIAFIHHSNFAASGARENRGCRSENVTAAVVEQTVADAGGHLLVQERINWAAPELVDCLTLFGKASQDGAPARIANPAFMQEAQLIHDNQSPYSRIGRGRPKPRRPVRRGRTPAALLKRFARSLAGR
ncbi:class I SAM-dependent methyltransferase [Faunimonas sp. B44]|uniref:class I SAM-dependent methyltransferase n=1 Tax=Faunimonas sp. B44 TaxID=3461493 RepID=UPI0040441044